MSIQKVLLSIVFLFLMSQIAAQEIFNPFIKYSWKDSAQYDVQYGELLYDEDYDCTIKETDDISTGEALSLLTLGVKEYLSKLKPTKRNILFYIHGMGGHADRFAKFNNAHIERDIIANEDSPYGLLVTLRWKGTFSYTGNIPRCIEIGHHYANLILEIKKAVEKINPGVEMSLITHSMGNRIFEGIFEEMNRIGKFNLFEHWIAAAADIEPDVFYPGNTLSDVGKLVEHVSVYVHNTDRILTITEQLSKKKRLGLRGVDNLNNIDSSIKIVDASLLNDIEGFDLGNHRYYTESPTMRRDMNNILSNNVEALDSTRKKLQHDQRYLILFENDQ